VAWLISFLRRRSNGVKLPSSTVRCFSYQNPRFTSTDTKHCQAPPPPYENTNDGKPSADGHSNQSFPTLASVTGDNDEYAFLRQFDTVIVVDDSSSMSGALWKEVDEALQAITPICTARDKDGVDLYFLNHRSSDEGGKYRADGGYYNITNADNIRAIFRTVSPGPTGERLNSILKPYVDSLARARVIESIRSVNIIVITDGRPTDDPESIIVQQARKLDRMEAPPHQIGIQFFQVGNDRKARDAPLELDEELVEQGTRDMVDTAAWNEADGLNSKALTADGILKVVLGAVVRKLDRKDIFCNTQPRCQ
jgi:hypothetical protein